MTPSLVGAFHAVFWALPPPLGGHHLLGSFIVSLWMAAQVWSPLFLHFRIWWGTQAIDYSWASLNTFHAAQTSSARIQDVDVLSIWRFYLRGSNLEFHGLELVLIIAPPRMHVSSLDTCIRGRAIIHTSSRPWNSGFDPRRWNFQIKITSNDRKFYYKASKMNFGMTDAWLISQISKLDIQMT